MHNDLEKLIGEIITEATERHKTKAIEYWTCLRLMVDTHKGPDTYLIQKARRLINATS